MSQNSERPGCWPTYLCLKKASAPCSSPASGGPAALLRPLVAARWPFTSAPLPLACAFFYGLAARAQGVKKSSLRSKLQYTKMDTYAAENERR